MNCGLTSFDFTGWTLYKVGGSLLNWPEFPEKLSQLISVESRAVIVVGGGPAANVVRDWDHRHHLGEARAHDLAIHSLSLTARLVAEMLPQAQLISSPAELAASWDQPERRVLLLADWLPLLEPVASCPLPHHWGVTSDSIALWLAMTWDFSRMVLVKSVEKPAASSQAQNPLVVAAEAGEIDSAFPSLFSTLVSTRSRSTQRSPSGSGFSLEWCCLREVEPKIEGWISH